jgi:hypothetical protein
MIYLEKIQKIQLFKNENEKHEANQLLELASGDYVSRATFLLASRVISQRRGVAPTFTIENCERRSQNCERRSQL